jgi:acyl-CoA synthetase (AMP-forming)/AMP-acid ligase II
LPEGPQDVAGILDRHVLERPNAVALVGRNGRLTFAQLDEEVHAAAAFLHFLGVEPGDRVAACAGNDTEIVAAFLAVQRLGAIWVGINRKYAPPEKRFLIEDAGARVFLADADAVADIHRLDRPPQGLDHIVSMQPGDGASAWRQGLRRFAGARIRRAPADPWASAAIAYTSGTTGHPKGVVHSQHSIVLAAWVAAVNSGRTDADVIRGSALPLTILNLMIHGPVCAYVTGACHVCIDRIDAEGVAEWIEKERVNSLSLVPTVVRDLLTRPSIRRESLASVSWLLSGAATVPQDLPKLYEERFGRRFTIGYGLTECPTGVTMTRDDSPDVQGCIGRPHFHLQVAICDQSGSLLSAGKSGEICFRAIETGPWANVYSGPLGYWRRPEATAALWRNGWVHSGDIGYLDERGELYIQDRRCDLIIRGGANVYPAEVERVLRLHPRVRDCAVAGIPDPRLGQVVAAFIEAYDRRDTESLVADLTTLCRREIAEYKIPARWAVVESLPRNAMGKIIKSQLVALLAQ